MVDLRKNDPWQKIKTLPAGQTRNRRLVKPSRDVKEFKYRPLPYALRNWQRHAVNTPQKSELYAQVIKSSGIHYHPPTRKWNFWNTLMIAWNGCSWITGDP